MKAFAYYNAKDVKDAVAALSRGGGMNRLIAGGTDLLGEMKNGYVTPERVVNLKQVRGLDRISYSGRNGLSIGALALLTDVAESDRVRDNYPGLAEAAESVGSPQLRNMGTIGGNLCQRPRCWYYRGKEYNCIRKGGGHCFAVSGRNKYHCIVDGGPCFIVHPSDTAAMLRAMKASVKATGPDGERTIALEEFFVLPGDDPMVENVLGPDEVITEITVPPPARGDRSCYLKFKERESRDFALVSAAVVLTMDGDTCRNASIVLGGVSPVPHRASAAEEALAGKKIDMASVQLAAEAALSGAMPMGENEYKIPLTKTIIRRAVLRAAGVEI